MSLSLPPFPFPSLYIFPNRQRVTFNYLIRISTVHQQLAAFVRLSRLVSVFVMSFIVPIIPLPISAYPSYSRTQDTVDIKLNVTSPLLLPLPAATHHSWPRQRAKSFAITREDEPPPPAEVTRVTKWVDLLGWQI